MDRQYTLLFYGLTFSVPVTRVLRRPSLRLQEPRNLVGDDAAFTITIARSALQPEQASLALGPLEDRPSHVALRLLLW